MSPLAVPGWGSVVNEPTTASLARWRRTARRSLEVRSRAYLCGSTSEASDGWNIHTGYGAAASTTVAPRSAAGIARSTGREAASNDPTATSNGNEPRRRPSPRTIKLPTSSTSGASARGKVAETIERSTKALR